MNVTIPIPTSLDDITIEQYTRLNELNDSGLEGVHLDNEILKLFTGIDEVGNISQIDRDSILKSIGEALLNEGEFKQRFKIDGIEFGMIPNFDKLVGSEYTDLIKYSDDLDNIHRLMAVAYRPVKLKDVFKNYQIVNYSGTSEMAEIMKQTPMSVVKGFNGFFLSLSNDLEGHILRCTEAELMKETQH